MSEINQPIPKEDHEAESLATWLRYKQYKFTHIANESGQKGTANIIQMMAKKKRMGTSPWFPDFCIILKRWSLLFIELKRQRKKKKNWELGASPSAVSDEQKAWVASLSALDNVMACIAYWWEDAKAWVEHFEEI